jgi:hypothetical protein
MDNAAKLTEFVGHLKKKILSLLRSLKTPALLGYTLIPTFEEHII